MKFLSQINVNTRYTLPMVDGTNGQVLSTDGNGVAYWGTISVGSLTLDGLSDVSIVSPSSDQILRYGLRQGDTVPVWHNFTPNFLTPSSSIDSLGDVSITTAATGQLLRYNGSAWVNWTPNFLTAEADTLATVTARGATTNGNIVINGEATIQNSGYLRLIAGSSEMSGFTVFNSAQNGYLSNRITTSAHSRGWGWEFTTNEANNNAGNVYFRVGYNGAISYLNSGNFGIGTDNPLAKLDVVGHTYIRGGQLYVDTIAGYSAAVVSLAGSTNFIVPSGNIGIRTTTPQKFLDVNGSGIVASFGGSISTGSFAGVHFGYSESYLNNDNYKKSAIVFERTDNHGQGNNASGKIHFLLNNIGSASATSLAHSVMVIDTNSTATQGSARVGIGTTSPNSTLDVNGAANATSFSSTALLITNADTSGSLRPNQGDPANKIYSFRWQGNEGGYIDTDNKITFSGFKTPAGTSSQFLKANGTVDSSTYLNSTALNGYATQAWVNTNYYDRNLIDDLFSGAEEITGYNRSNWDAAYNDKINSATFSTTTGVLTLTQQDTGTVTVDLDGRYLESLPTATSTVLGGIKVGTNLSISNGVLSATDTDTVTSVGIDGDLSTGNIELRGGGATTITKSGGTITISSTDTDTNTTYSAGTGLTLTGTTFSVTSGTYAAASHNHDDRYYTETESDSRYVNASGDTMSGDLTLSGYTNPHITLTTTGGNYSYLELLDGSSAGYVIKNQTSSTSNGVLPGSLYLYTDSSKATQIVHNGTSNAAFLSGGDVYIRGQVYVGGNGASTGTQLVYNSGTWGINITGSAGSATTSSSTYRGIIEDTRAAQRTPNDYDDYRVSWEFTNQIPGLSGNTSWWSVMTMQGWHNGYSAWQIIGSSSSAIDDFYLRAGNNTTWNTARRIWHSGDFTSTDVSNWNTAYGWGDHAEAGYLTDFSYTETDTLSSVTGRGGSTGSAVVMYGKVTLGNNSSGTYNGNTTGLTINSTAEIRSTGIQNPPALTWHYEGLATRHLLITSAGAMNFVSPSNEASGVAVVQVNGNTVWHAGNLTNLNQLTNGPGYITSYTETDTLSSVTGRGATTSNLITINSIDVGLKVQENGTSTAWRGRIGSFNSTADKSSFLGNYTGRAGVFGHNNALTAWDDLWVNTLGIYGQGNLYLSWNTYVKGNTTDTNYSIWHAGNFTDNSANWNTAYNDRISSAAVTGTTTKTLTLTQGDGGTITATWTDYDTDTDAQQLTWTKATSSLTISNGNSVALEGLATEEFVTGQGYITGSYLPLSGGTLTGTLTMGTTGTQYIRMGRFPGSTTNTGEAWIGRASDRNTGTMTVQLGGNSASSRSFEVVDYAWSVVLFSVGSDGNLAVSGTITENSSIRYKKDVVDIESTSSKVQLLRPVKYKKIRDESEEIGLIAEDVAELFPEVVKYDNEGRPDGINYSRLSVILLKAVQELTERVNKLENK